MGDIFGGGGGQKPQKEFGVRVNQSIYGLPVPWVMGVGQVQQSLFWDDGFVATQQSQGKGSGGGGKGGGGKSGGNYFTYTVNVVSGLCIGPINGIGDVWSGSSWLGSPTAAETYTISGTGVYTPTNASGLYNDLGVGLSNSYSYSQQDVGAPTTTSLSGSDYAVMSRVDYTSVYSAGTMAAGQYAVDTAGKYYFQPNPVGGGGTYGGGQPGNGGQSVQISYSFQLTNIENTETDIVPSSGTIQVGGTFTFGSDQGVVYVNTGTALTRVSGTPSAAGQYQVTGSAPATYHFYTAGGSGGDFGAEVRITFSIVDASAVGQGQSQQLNFTLNNGKLGQSPYAFLTGSFPGAAIGYSGIATILYQPMSLGASGQVQQNKAEVITPDVMGNGIEDCNPVQCIYQVLTNSQTGLGVGPLPYPTACIDNGSGGTWGSAVATGTRSANSTAWNWCASNNFFISPVLDSQDSASTTVGKWLEAAMLASFFSEGLLKIVSYGDTTSAANGYTWKAPTAYVVALDDTCFIKPKNGDDPVKIDTPQDIASRMNAVQIQWDNRFNQYSPEITQEMNQGSIAKWGERREDPQNWNFIHTIKAATFAANMRVKHNCYIPNNYTFGLPYTYSYLEPMDLLEISTTSAWAQGLNNVNLSLTNQPVRIIKIVDDPKTGLQITCEDYPWGAHLPTIYNKGIASGDVTANAFADPGASEVVMWEATSRETGFAGNTIRIVANGYGKFYGYTNVYVSSDGGTKYEQIGSIQTPGRLGTLASTFASGSDPDTTNSLVVRLAENCAALTPGSSGDADNKNTLCFVDGELIAYSACTVTGQNTYTMGTYIRRGLHNTTISSHSAGSLFARVDASVFDYQYDPNWAGQTLKFKFQSVNAFGNNPQPLSSLTAVNFTVPGKNPGTVDASSGLTTKSGPTFPVRPIGPARPVRLDTTVEGAGPLGWAPVTTTT
jgi:hypothetical protein